VVKIEVTCDRCRTIITADRTKLAIETGPLQTTLATDPGSSHIDLCTDCARALLTWLWTSVPGHGPASTL
jgi:hypothetical protein